MKTKYPTFNFEIDEIKNYANKLEIDEQLIYLLFCYKEIDQEYAKDPKQFNSSPGKYDYYEKYVFKKYSIFQEMQFRTTILKGILSKNLSKSPKQKEIVAEVEKTKDEQAKSSLNQSVKVTKAGAEFLFSEFEGLKWEEIHITFESEYLIKIIARNKSKRMSFSQLTFSDKRRDNMPNSLWKTLKILATFHGEISFKSKVDEKAKKPLKKMISNLRKKLKSIFNIDDDPFYDYKISKAYRTKFALSYPQIQGNMNQREPNSIFDEMRSNLPGDSIDYDDL